MWGGSAFRRDAFLSPVSPKHRSGGGHQPYPLLQRTLLKWKANSFIHALSVFPVTSPSLPFLSISFRAGPMEYVRLQGCSLHKVIWPLGTEGSDLHTQIHCGARGPMEELACSRPLRSSCQRATGAAPPLPSSQELCPFIAHLFTVTLKGVSS